jgi:hypothetical protein
MKPPVTSFSFKALLSVDPDPRLGLDSDAFIVTLWRFIDSDESVVSLRDRTLLQEPTVVVVVTAMEVRSFQAVVFARELLFANGPTKAALFAWRHALLIRIMVMLSLSLSQ